MGTVDGVAFDQLCDLEHVPRPIAEYRFAPPRRWKFDWAWPRELLALEVDGGAFLPGGGRHTRGAGYRADLEKFNAATLAGWRVLHVLPEQLATSDTFDMLRRALAVS